MSDHQRWAAVRSAYDAVADTYADFFRSTEPEDPADLEFIARFASSLAQPKRVLDAGCGAGRMMPLLARHGCLVQGLDLSPEMVRRAHTDHGCFASTVGSITALPYGADTFDGAFYWYSTIHSPDEDLPVILAHARRVLRAGGLALFACQSGVGITDVSGVYRRHGHEIDLVRYNRTAARMAGFLATAGFTVVDQLIRPATGSERDDQAFLLARSGVGPLDFCPVRGT